MVLTDRPDTPIAELPAITYEDVRKMTLLDCVLKETLRLHPPIHTIMRKVEKDLTYKGYTIPKGHFICGAPSVSQLDPKRFPEPEKFIPKRFINNDEGSGEWTINGVDMAQKSAKSHFLPFGAGEFASCPLKKLCSPKLIQAAIDALEKPLPLSKSKRLSRLLSGSLTLPSSPTRSLEKESFPSPTIPLLLLCLRSRLCWL